MATTENKDSKKVEKKAKPKKERKFHPIRYFREMFGELKKLTWLSGKDLVSHTLAVIVFVLGMAALIWALDLAFSSALGAISQINLG